MTPDLCSRFEAALDAYAASPHHRLKDELFAILDEALLHLGHLTTKLRTGAARGGVS